MPVFVDGKGAIPFLLDAGMVGELHQQSRSSTAHRHDPHGIQIQWWRCSSWFRMHLAPLSDALTPSNHWHERPCKCWMALVRMEAGSKDKAMDASMMGSRTPTQQPVSTATARLHYDLPDVRFLFLLPLSWVDRWVPSFNAHLLLFRRERSLVH